MLRVAEERGFDCRQQIIFNRKMMMISIKRFRQPHFFLNTCFILKVVLMMSLLFFPFEQDVLSDFVKEIISHQKGNVFRFYSQNLNCEVQHFFDVILARFQIGFCVFFDSFDDVIDTLSDDCIPFFVPFCLVCISLF